MSGLYGGWPFIDDGVAVIGAVKIDWNLNDFD